MLAIVCFVYETQEDKKNAALPHWRTDLYERCVEALVLEWDRSRGINREPSFTSTEIELVLRNVAYDGLLADKIDFAQPELLALIRAHLTKVKRRMYEDTIFLKEVVEHTGLFKPKGKDVGFIHLTFQDFFASQIIAEKVLLGIERKNVRTQIRDVLKNITNPRWAEPITLAAGILKGRTELVSTLFEEVKGRNDPEVWLLLAGALRDSDLNSEQLKPNYMLIQDEILEHLVESAFPQESFDFRNESV